MPFSSHLCLCTHRIESEWSDSPGADIYPRDFHHHCGPPVSIHGGPNLADWVISFHRPGNRHRVDLGGWKDLPIVDAQIWAKD